MSAWTSGFSRGLGVGLLLAFSINLGGCEEIDDQTLTPVEALPSVNPAPEGSGFAAVNERHQVLMAVIDTGTDYNHPLIRENIHFDLDTSGNPVGVGFDFVGQDRWPSPYVALTAHLNPDADEKAKGFAERTRKRTLEALERFPDLAKFFDPHRNLAQEGESGAYHGTHVAGLMTYDEPRLGLMIYRVLPSNVVFKDGERVDINESEVIVQNMLQAITSAIDGGARIVNLSLGLLERKDGGGLSSKSPESVLAQQRAWMNEIKKIALANPDVVLVAAAGNDGQWVDEKTTLQLPCGVSAPNILCVGALNADGDLASFSNILLTDAPFIAAPGSDIVSLFPTKMCDSMDIDLLSREGAKSPFDNPESTERFWKGIETECRASNGLKSASGTSMASPIVARMLGKLLLERPELNGQQVIQALLASGDRVKMGPLEIARIRVEKPSWYKDIDGGNGVLSTDPASKSGESASGYFELFTPKKAR